MFVEYKMLTFFRIGSELIDSLHHSSDGSQDFHRAVFHESDFRDSE